MIRFYTKYLILGLACLSFNFISADENSRKASMLGDLEFVKHTLEACYAPAAWKKSYANWDLDVAFNQAKDLIINKKNLSTKEFHQILNRFLNTTQDYHVQVRFFSTESAFLPFTVRFAEDHYFIDWIDSKALSNANFHINIGDELLEFDGSPVEKVVAQLIEESGLQSNTETDRSLSCLYLTDRKGARGFVVPRGPVQVKVKSVKSGQIHVYQLIWDHFPELIKSPKDKPWYTETIWSLFNCLNDDEEETGRLSIRHSTMLSPFFDSDLNEKCERPSIGAYRSYVPTLGKVIWESQNEMFNAYVYELNGKKIGYVRIPHYSGTMSNVRSFGQLIAIFQNNTDALVIDQVRNPGGTVLYKYSLASMLTDKPLITPRHCLKINQADVLLAYLELAELEQVKSDEDMERLIEDDFFFKTYEYALFLKEYCRFIINEWEEGRTYTQPIYIDGVDHVNPHPKISYTKPILVLIDELDFSGGDFFPAVLQDNKRATLFGTKTAGAGGCVRKVSFPNSNGIFGIYYTLSLAERANGKTIENLGVSPDIEYQITADDLQHGYKAYGSAVNAAVQSLIVEKKSPEVKENK